VLTYDFSVPAPRKGLYGYYDASFADDLDTRRSTMGFIFFKDGCSVSWSAKLHSFVTTSTNHSEYCAAAKAAREARSKQILLNEIGMPQPVIDLFIDSQF
jgi:hypothetical protein